MEWWGQGLATEATRAVLRHGRTERVRLEEIPVGKRAPVLKAYLQRAPGARAHVPVDKDAPLEKFETIAAQIHARHRYALDEIKPNARFADILQMHPDGTRILDYGEFHEIVEGPTELVE